MDRSHVLIVEHYLTGFEVRYGAERQTLQEGERRIWEGVMIGATSLPELWTDLVSEGIA